MPRKKKSKPFVAFAVDNGTDEPTEFYEGSGRFVGDIERANLYRDLRTDYTLLREILGRKTARKLLQVEVSPDFKTLTIVRHEDDTDTRAGDGSSDAVREQPDPST